ncbi:hypothetical protein PRK78_004735 [Emydomyces testavorans]|uniref:Rrn9 domain-containing protein n=1 Tax=Emydomyces testavorans TaxID=2070801 RepID=A0AAF0DI87_9EURO|nr:hypothetical protein PRK78_004735 [Emydomyces testavorans]
MSFSAGMPYSLQDAQTSNTQDVELQPVLLPQLDDPDDLSYEDSGSEASSVSENGLIDRKASDESEESSDRNLSLSEDESPERPNRFEGSRRAWRLWTKRERQEVAALETIRARDLSLHLYNAFALKRTARILKEQRHRNIGEAEDRSSDDGISRDDLPAAFAPTRAWTAWPLPADIVPRTAEKVTRDEDEDWTFKVEPDARPSAELEECLTAQMMKAAKERFQAREWARGSTRSRRSQKPGSDSEAMASGKEEHDGDHFVSAAQGVLRPVIQADDEESKRILLPETRHVISKFDELLLNLYHARQAYLTMADLSQPEDETEDESQRNIFPGPHQRRKRSRKTSRSSSSHSNAGKSHDVTNDSSPVSSSPSDTKKRVKRVEPRIARLGLRDWSDVLGVASMMGWPNAAVMRAARRCADLFDQDMIFRTLNEGKVHLEQDEDSTASWKYVENEDEEDVNMADEGPSVPEYIDRPKEYAVFCPVEECKRHKQGFSRKWNLDQHMKIKHPAFAEDST